MRRAHWAPEARATYDIRIGSPGPGTTEKAKAFASALGQERTALAEWMRAYNAELRRRGYKNGIRFGKLISPKVVARLELRRRAA